MRRLGFSTTAVILGGQTLASIKPDTLPLVVGIVIVSVCSFVPCFIGYDLVHAYERCAWIVTFAVMLFLYGLGGSKGFDINAQEPFEDTGRNLTADILSFGGIVFGSFTGVRRLCVFRYLLTLNTLVHAQVGSRSCRLQLPAPGHDLL